MRIPRPTLADTGLLLLALAVGVLVLGVLTGRLGQGTSAPAAAVVSPPTPGPSASPSASPSPVSALLVGDALATGLGPQIGSALGWDVTVEAAPGTGFVTGDPAQQPQSRITSALEAGTYDVVALLGATADADPPDGGVFGGNVAAAVAAVHAAQPEAEVVLIGPVGTEADTFRPQRDVLSAVAARFGAYFIDPVGRQWLVGKPQLTTDGAPNDSGYAEMARRLTADLTTTFPSTLLPKA